MKAQNNTTMKKIVDADRMVIIGHFNESDTDKKISELESRGMWNDISVDVNGDIICWEE